MKTTRRQDNSRVHVHATNSTAVPANTNVVKSSTRALEDPPVACTSNGDPPPESAFDSCAVGGGVGRAALLDGAGGCATFVVDPPAIEVGFGSVFKPCDEVLDDDNDDDDDAAADCEFADDVDVEVEVEVFNEDAGGAADVALEVAACVLVCAAFVLEN
jgi:hypothetical protein